MPLFLKEKSWQLLTQTLNWKEIQRSGCGIILPWLDEKPHKPVVHVVASVFTFIWMPGKSM